MTESPNLKQESRKMEADTYEDEMSQGTADGDAENLTSRSSSAETETCNDMSPDTLSEASDQFNMDCLKNGVTLMDNSVQNNLLCEVVLLREQNRALQKDLLRLENENSRLEADISPDLHAIQLETLEKTMSQQKLEVERLQGSLREQNDTSHKNMLQFKQDYETKLLKLTKQYEVANKERESMVMKYAVSEKTAINLKRDLQQQENKTKDAIKEKDLIHVKLKAVIAEKARIHKLFDTKNSEVTTLEREIEKKNEVMYNKEQKIKWTESRLKVEMDNHKETQGKLDKLQMKLNEVREETQQVRKDSQALLRSYQESQEVKTNREQEEKARIIIDKHDEESLQAIQAELESCKNRHQALIDENNHLCIKIQNLEKERFEYDSNLARLKQAVDVEKQAVVDLQAQLTELESTKLILQHEQERCAASQAEVERLRSSNCELQQEMSGCREREAELLDFTQKLTEKNVRLQSEFTAMEARVQQLDLEEGVLKRQVASLTSTNTSLADELSREKTQRQEESQVLARHLAERTQKSEVLAQRVEDLQGEAVLLKKKHVASLKELTKEVATSRKRLEMYENTMGSLSITNGSRASSNTSLNTAETTEGKSSSSQTSPAPGIQAPSVVEPDKQMLMNKIVKVQRRNAKMSEKLEFLEEHSSQLTAELQRKTRIIQNYIVREQSGALSSSSMDENKVALSKHGGIMASLYNSRPVDDAMTLELSLEINQKLQAVLEDTLLKNITLKENMETLGNEIARLASQPRSQPTP